VDTEGSVRRTRTTHVSRVGGRTEAHSVGGDTGRANVAPRAFDGGVGHRRRFFIGRMAGHAMEAIHQGL